MDTSKQARATTTARTSHFYLAGGPFYHSHYVGSPFAQEFKFIGSRLLTPNE
jgi:hypothetical protein